MGTKLTIESTGSKKKHYYKCDFCSVWCKSKSSFNYHFKTKESSGEDEVQLCPKCAKEIIEKVLSADQTAREKIRKPNEYLKMCEVLEVEKTFNEMIKCMNDEYKIPEKYIILPY